MNGIHPLDLAIIVLYLVVVLWLGYRASRAARNQEGLFLAGRKLGKLYQFLLNFGNATDANGAVSTSSLVYQQGVSGCWVGFQLIFLNPYYWFMYAWFRRSRLVTTADLFEDRLGSRRLASFYAVFQAAATIFVVIGFGNLITYKICSALVVKPAAAWNATERDSVEGFREMRTLEHEARSLSAGSTAKLAELRERDARGELRSYIPAFSPLPFYVAYTLIVGAYVVMGGMTATAMNEIIQSFLTLLFSAILIPLGMAAIGGWSQLSVRVPAEMFDLLAIDTGAQQVTGLVLIALILVSLIQINGIIGNMSIAGSARDEFAARFGGVAGNYGKRFITIMWAFCGLIALALYSGADALADPDAAWGTMSRQLLGPGLLGLMIVGVLANNMDTVAAQTLSVSALFVRNVYAHFRPGMDEAEAVVAGRWAMVITLGFGIVAALQMDSVFSALILVKTVSVPFGAVVLLMFFWRRLTVAGAWLGLVCSVGLNIVGPFALAQFPALRAHPMLTARSEDARGRLVPVYFEKVVRTDAIDPANPLKGQGRLHTELVVLKLVGVPVERMTESNRFAVRFFFDAFAPFILLMGFSLVTCPPAQARVDLFYGKMKTPVDPMPELDQAAMATTRRDPHRFDHTKLLGAGSAWEFTRWDRVDTIGFLICCGASAGIIALFWFLLRLAAGAG